MQANRARHVGPGGRGGPVSFTEFRYSHHARERMRTRHIREAQVESTVNEPDRRSEDGGRFIAERDTTQGNIVQVVYTVDSSGAAVVITAMRIKGRRS